MEDVGTLELLAELSIGVLGFSGVVAVLGRRASGDWDDLDRVRFRVMVRIAALVLVLSLLPSSFRSAESSESSTWLWCSGMGILLYGLFIASYAQAADRKRLRMWSNPAVSRPAHLYTLFAAFVAPLLLGLNATGIVFERAATPYLVALLLLFGVSIVAFLRLLETEVGAARRATQKAAAG